MLEKNNDYQRIMSLAKHMCSLDNELITKAIAFSKKIHQNETRLTNDPFIVHPLAAARIIADMGLGADLIAAALLHDTIEHGASVTELENCMGSQVTELIKSVTIEKKTISLDNHQWAFYDSLKELMTKDYGPFYLKLAGRIDNLRTIHACDPETQERKICETEKIYLPQTREIRSTYLYQMLQDALFKATFPKIYTQINNTYHNVLSRNAYVTQTVRNLLKDIFLNSCYDCQYLERAHIYDCIVRQRTIFEIHKEVQNQSQTSRNNYERIITKYTVPLYDIFLILQEQCTEDPLALFLSIYKECLVKNSIFLTDILTPVNAEPVILLLEDHTRNQYRLHLFQRGTYEFYLYGTDPRRSTYLPQKTNPASGPSLIVYALDNQKKYIEKGATALDFAFLINKNIGLCAQKAIVNGNEVPLSTELTNHDHVQIITNYYNGVETPCAQFSWIEIVKTPRARTYLARWFEKNYVRKPGDTL